MCIICRPVRQQLIKRILVVAEGIEGCGQQPTSIGITPSMSSLNRISQEVQIHPSPSKTCLLRKQIPRLDNRHFNQIYPSDNVIRVVQKSHGVHDVKMREVAAWVLNATHWFSLLKQPMMIVIWCRDWSDASKFQYLMQILQVQFQDYVPKYHIFVDQEDNVDKLIQYWQARADNSMGWSTGHWVHGRDVSR